MHFITTILVLLIGARALGQIFKRLFNQPSLVGEILAGVIVGSAVLGIVEPTRELAGIAELTVFLIIFSAGLEMELKEVFTAMRGPGLPVAIFGFMMPQAVGFGLTYFFDMSAYSAAVVGLCMAITALPVALRFVNSLGLSNKPLGQNVIGAAVIIDIVALLVLGIVLDAPASQKWADVINSVLSNGLKMAGFFGVVLGLDWIVSKKLKTNFFHRWLGRVQHRFGEDTLFGVAVTIVLVFSAATESLGFHFVIGAFFGGMLLSKEFIGKELFGNIEKTLNSVSTGFLSPIFFAYIGLQFGAEAFSNPLLLLAIVIGGLLAKTIGAFIGGKLAGISNRECWSMSVILNGRGVMDLVVAEIALHRGYITKEVFSSLVILGILSTFVAPIIYRKLNADEPSTDMDGATPATS
ncbi:MAG: sodium:proton antiporter [Bdellovibrionaceae bacterium]|nr:sodium:proton antiporter [Pseudobdellovibrionaceae bacterium]